jgi:ABC-2 type transport system ATP-binding protein
MLAVETQELTKVYGDKRAVDGLSFGLKRGEILGLLGPNGAGKTTTVDMLCGLIRPDGGRATIMGHDVVKEQTQVHRHIGVVFQEIGLYENLTAWENLIFHARLYQVPRREITQRAMDALELVQLTARKGERVGTFSGGMKRRLALVRSLLHLPSVLLLDEPTLGIDVQARNVIWERILTLRDQNKGILLCTNYMEEANALCDRVIIIDQGKAVVVDTPQALKKSLGGDIVRLSVSDLPDQVEARLDALGIRDVSIQTSDDGGYDVSLRVERSERTFPALVDLFDQTGRVSAISIREPSMNDVFLALTGRALRD